MTRLAKSVLTLLAVAATMFACGGGDDEPLVARSTTAAAAPAPASSSSSAEAEPAPADDQGISVVALVTYTCHDQRTAGGNSDQHVTFQTDLPAGATAVATWKVSNPADGAPASRTVSATVAEDGSMTFVVPVYAEGESATLDSMTINGPVEVTGDAGFVVAPLDDPDSECDTPE